MPSIWTETVLPQFEPLKENQKTDVLIIGGGIAGLLCAYLLEHAGVPYILVEASRICGGITKDTTAKITAQHGLIYNKLIQEFGPEKTKLYLNANQEALKKYRALCQTIDCDFQENDSFAFALDDRKKIEEEWRTLQTIAQGHIAQALPINQNFLK